MKKILFAIFFVFNFWLFSTDIFAFDYPDFHELMGLTYDEYLDSLDENGVFTFYYSSLFSTDNPDFIKEDTIRLTNDNISWVYDCPYDYMDTSGTMAFGELKTYGQLPISVTLTLYNNGNPLFSSPGVLTLKAYCYSTDLIYTVYRSDGSSSSHTLVAYNNTGTIFYPTFDVLNSDNDIVKIVFTYTGYIPQSTGGGLMGVGICDYGYIVDEVDEPVEPEEPPIVISGDLNGTIMYMLSFIISVLNVFFILEIIPGVTFGYFILACMIMSLVFSFFFHRMIK